MEAISIYDELLKSKVFIFIRYFGKYYTIFLISTIFVLMYEFLFNDNFYKEVMGSEGKGGGILSKIKEFVLNINKVLSPENIIKHQKKVIKKIGLAVKKTVDILNTLIRYPLITSIIAIGTIVGIIKIIENPTVVLGFVSKTLKYLIEKTPYDKLFSILSVTPIINCTFEGFIKNPLSNTYKWIKDTFTKSNKINKMELPKEKIIIN